MGMLLKLLVLWLRYDCFLDVLQDAFKGYTVEIVIVDVASSDKIYCWSMISLRFKPALFSSFFNYWAKRCGWLYLLIRLNYRTIKTQTNPWLKLYVNCDNDCRNISTGWWRKPCNRIFQEKTHTLRVA